MRNGNSEQVTEMTVHECRALPAVRWTRSSGNFVQCEVDLRVNRGGRLGEELAKTYLVFAGEQATEISIDRLRQLGWDGKNIKRLDGLGSRNAKVRRTVSEWNGRPQVKYEVLTPMNEELEPQEFDVFASRLNAFMAAGLEGSGAHTDVPPFDDEHQ